MYQEGIALLSPTQIAQYNTIDRIYTEAQIAAERKCRKFHAGNIPWTPSLTQAIYRILYWKGIRKCLTGRRIATVILQQRAQRGQLEHQNQHLLLNMAEVAKKLKEAVLDYLQIKKQANRRDSWLSQVIAAQAIATGTSKKSRWKKI